MHSRGDAQSSRLHCSWVCKGSGSSPGNEFYREFYCSSRTTSENESAKRGKDNLVMRQCAKSLGPHGISRVEKACCEIRNELRE